MLEKFSQGVGRFIVANKTFAFDFFFEFNCVFVFNSTIFKLTLNTFSFKRYILIKKYGNVKNVCL